MRVLSREFLTRCPYPLINVHPALLPLLDEPPDSFPVLRGAHAVRDALALGLTRTGVSIHHVTPEVDAGPVIVREVVPISPQDDEVSLYARIKAVEHRLLPHAVRTVLSSHVVGGVYA
jgi:phosphoribosylglycinamide formyltransferase-1